MIVADSSDDVVWPAMLHFIKQVVGGVGASPEGNHYSIVTFARGATGIVTFPVGEQAISQYSAPMVQRFIEAGAARRSRGREHDVDVALGLARTLLTNKGMGARPNAQKVTFVWCLKGTLFEDRCV